MSTLPLYDMPLALIGVLAPLVVGGVVSRFFDRLFSSPAHVAAEPNAEARTALTLVQNRQSVFITGKAGTGKSTLLRQFRKEIRGNTVVLAPTGLAAINVGGQTVHSFFKLKPGYIDPATLRPSRRADLYRKIDTLIIDEVSMVRADLMDAIDAQLRLDRGRPNTPFGGVHVVLFGDVFQLPPIVKEPALQQLFADRYGGPHFFRAHALRQSQFALVELERVYRQRDPRFVDLLNRIRVGEVSDEALAPLNERVQEAAAFEQGGDYVTLTPTNEAAGAINAVRLSALQGSGHTFTAEVSGRFDDSAFPTDLTLRLKEGARIMMVKNDPEKRWVNGSLGTVRRAGPHGIRVSVGGSDHDVEPTTWENVEYEYDRRAQKIEQRTIGTFRQYPLRPAWAITIHKSQGQTFDRVYLDLAGGTFAPGQLYVALSRCRNLNSLGLSRPVFTTDIIYDGSAADYRAVFEPR